MGRKNMNPNNNNNCENHTFTNNVSSPKKNKINNLKKNTKVESESDKTFPQPSKPVNAAN